MPTGIAVVLLLLAGTAAAQAAGDRALGEYLSTECVTCHRVSGPPVAGIPAIRGWPADQFVAVMSAYKTKQRENIVMQSIAGRLSQDDLEALAAYFGSLKN
jgi:cytochrome c553